MRSRYEAKNVFNKIQHQYMINKLRTEEKWHIQMMGYYSALKRNDLSSLEKTWKELQCILLSERSQSEKAIYCMLLSHFSCVRLCDPTRLLCPWDFPGKNTGVGCHCLLPYTV